MSKTEKDNSVETAGASVALMGLIQKTKQAATPPSAPVVKPVPRQEVAGTERTSNEKSAGASPFPEKRPQPEVLSARERQSQAIDIGRRHGFTTIEKIDRRKTKPKHTPFHVSLSDSTIAAIRGYTDDHGFGSNREFIEYLIRLYEDSLSKKP